MYLAPRESTRLSISPPYSRCRLLSQKCVIYDVSVGRRGWGARGWTVLEGVQFTCIEYCCMRCKNAFFVLLIYFFLYRLKINYVTKVQKMRLLLGLNSLAANSTRSLCNFSFLEKHAIHIQFVMCTHHSTVSFLDTLYNSFFSFLGCHHSTQYSSRAQHAFTSEPFYKTHFPTWHELNSVSFPYSM
jgi:hypothetical protein